LGVALKIEIKILISASAAIGIIFFQNCAPPKLNQQSAFENIDLVQFSDMRLTNDQYNFFTQSAGSERIAGNAAIESNSDGTRKWGLWPKNAIGNVVIPVKFGPNITTTNISQFLSIANKWATNPVSGLATKLKFVKWSTQASFLYVAFANCGMSATMGYSVTQFQDSCRPGYANAHMNLISDFFTRIANGSKWAPHALDHELGHVIGFAHEHQRADRDKYIKIVWANIPSGQEGTYAVVSAYKSVNAYDFHSVMHYSSHYENDDCTKGAQRITYADGSYFESMCNAISPGDYSGLKTLYGL